MPRQMSADEHSRLMPTMDRKHGTGAGVFDTASNAEAGLKTITRRSFNRGPARRQQPHLRKSSGGLIRRWLQATSVVR
jgi:hypothetical protein